MPNCKRLWVSSAVVLAVTGCAGNGNGLDANGRPVGSGGSGGGPLTADFQSIQDHVFTPICTACHAGASAPQGLRLDAANSYNLLVGVPSQERPALLRVKPGDPSQSYLIQKLEGTAAVGARMPFGGPYLDQATIDVIRQWITDGAQRSPASAPRVAFAVTSTAPASGEVLDEAPSSIVIGFTRELDRTRIDESVVLLERTALDASDETQVSVPVGLRVPDANGSALIVTPRYPLSPGRYTLRVIGTGLADLSGAPLGGADARSDTDVLTTFDVGGTR